MRATIALYRGAYAEARRRLEEPRSLNDTSPVHFEVAVEALDARPPRTNRQALRLPYRVWRRLSVKRGRPGARSSSRRTSPTAPRPYFP